MKPPGDGVAGDGGGGGGGLDGVAAAREGPRVVREGIVLHSGLHGGAGVVVGEWVGSCPPARTEERPQPHPPWVWSGNVLGSSASWQPSSPPPLSTSVWRAWAGPADAAHGVAHPHPLAINPSCALRGVARRRGRNAASPSTKTAYRPPPVKALPVTERTPEGEGEVGGILRGLGRGGGGVAAGGGGTDGGTARR